MPERTCVACWATRERADLLRVTRTPDGSVTLGEGPGRGAYVCRRASCVREAPRRLSRALRRPLDDDDLARLERAMEKELE